MIQLPSGHKCFASIRSVRKSAVLPAAGVEPVPTETGTSFCPFRGAPPVAFAAPVGDDAAPLPCDCRSGCSAFDLKDRVRMLLAGAVGLMCFRPFGECKCWYFLMRMHDDIWCRCMRCVVVAADATPLPCLTNRCTGTAVHAHIGIAAHEDSITAAARRA